MKYSVGENISLFNNPGAVTDWPGLNVEAECEVMDNEMHEGRERS